MKACPMNNAHNPLLNNLYYSLHPLTLSTQLINYTTTTLLGKHNYGKI